jgi:diaminohydroxyphosphoribosylaminopyrimidine deaminase/5-amino-6-(5-phosphoribosylamino)uracil reductase
VVAAGPVIAGGLPQTPADDLRYMQRALAHARRGLGRTTPNPVVGACIVSPDGVVVGQGAHERAGEPHAEVHALDEAGEAARGATLYCTLEPCAHTGRTGPCVARIIDAGITRVVAAMEDPYPLVQGRGFARLRDHGVRVDVGLCRDEAERLNRPFLTAVRHGRPFVILKAAVSADGHIAAGPGRRTPLTSRPALRHAQAFRAQVDAIGIGSETVIVDDPLLTAREIYRERPLARVVFDRRLRLPPAARLFSTLCSGPVIVLTVADVAAPDRVAVLERAGATVVVAPQAGLLEALRLLPAFGIQSLLLEGGSALHAAAWEAGVVDCVQVYTAPVSLGPPGLPFMAGRPFSFESLVDLTVTRLGPDILTEGYVHRPH